MNNLSNLAEGGKGGDTRKGFTEEEYQQWLKRKSESQKGKVGYWRGKERKKHSSKIEEKHKMGVYNYEWLSKPKSETHKLKLSESAMRRKRPMVKCDKCGMEVPNTHLAVHQRGKNCITSKI